MSMLTPEGIARRIKSLYEDNYATYLSTVQTAWASTEDIELHDFETRRITADPSNIAVFPLLPALGIAVGDMREDAGADQVMQQYTNYYLMDTQLAYFLRSIDDHQLSIILMRHIEATLQFLQDHARLDYSKDVGIRDLRIEPSANVMRSGGNMLVKGLLVRFDVRFIQRGF